METSVIKNLLESARPARQNCANWQGIQGLRERLNLSFNLKKEIKREREDLRERTTSSRSVVVRCVKSTLLHG